MFPIAEENLPDLTKYQIKQPNSTSDDNIVVASVVDDELSKIGWSENARLSLLGDVGRENGWNRNTIFAGHTDPNPANRKFNRGIISWQGDRREKLDKYLGGDYSPSDDNLRKMVRFMDKEMSDSPEWQDIHAQLRRPDISTSEASRLLQKYIKYVPTAPYNTPDDEFNVKNNRIYAEKAKRLGLGTLPDLSGFADSGEPLPDLSSFAETPAPEEKNSDVLGNLNAQKSQFERDLQSAKPMREKREIKRSLDKLNITIAEETAKQPIQNPNWQLAQPTETTFPVNQQAQTPKVDDTSADEQADINSLRQPATQIGQSNFAATPPKQETLPADYVNFLEARQAVDSPEVRNEYSDLLKNAPESFQPIPQIQNAASKTQQSVQQQSRAVNGKIPVVQPTAPQIQNAATLAPGTFDNTQKEVVGNVSFNKIYRKKPTAEEVFQDFTKQNYGKDALPALNAYASITGENLGALENKSGLQADIDAYWNPKTGEYNTEVPSPVYDKIKRVVEAFEKNGEQGIKDVLPKLKGEMDIPQFSPEQEDGFQSFVKAGKMKDTPEDRAKFIKSLNEPNASAAEDNEANLRQQAIKEIQADIDANSDPLAKMNPGAALYKPPVLDEATINARIEQLKRIQLDPETAAQAKADAEYLNENLSNLGSAAVGGVMGATARANRAVAGIMRPLSSLGIDAPYELFSKIAQKSEILDQNTGDGGRSAQLIKIAAGTPFDIARIAGLSRLPGGMVVGFAADSALQSAGKGENLRDVAKEGIKGAALGGVFGAAGKVGGAATKALQKNLVNVVDAFPSDAAYKAAHLTAKVFGEAAEIGTIAGGTLGVEKLAGTPDQEAAHSAIFNALFHVANKVGAKAFDKVYKIWENGKSENVYVDPKGNVKLLKGEVEPSYVDAEIITDPKSESYKASETAKNITPDNAKVNQPESKVTLTTESKPDVTDTNVGQSAQKLETSQTPRELAAQNPQRIENAHPDAIKEVSINPRAVKISDILASGETIKIEDLQKQTRYSRENVEEAVMSLYGARMVEIMPDGSIRRIASEKAAEAPKTLADKAKEKYSPQTEPIKLEKSSIENEIKQTAENKPNEAIVQEETQTVEAQKPIVAETQKPVVGSTISTALQGKEKTGTVTRIKERNTKSNRLTVEFEDGTKAFVSENKAIVKNVRANETEKKIEKTDEEPDREFSSTQVNLPAKESEKVLSLGKKLIKEEDIFVEEGREENPHVTVKYGLDTEDAAEVKKILADEKPFDVTLGKVSIFKGGEDVDYDVVKIDVVDSPELHRLNKKIAENNSTSGDTHPEYKPHATLAYVKKGMGAKYVGDSSLEGVKIPFSEIMFSGKVRDAAMVPIKLAGKAVSTQQTKALTPTEAFAKSIDTIFARSQENGKKAYQKERQTKFKQTVAGLETNAREVSENELDDALQTALDNKLLPDFVNHLKTKDLSATQKDQINVWIEDEKLDVEKFPVGNDGRAVAGFSVGDKVEHVSGTRTGEIVESPQGLAVRYKAKGVNQQVILTENNWRKVGASKGIENLPEQRQQEVLSQKPVAQIVTTERPKSAKTLNVFTERGTKASIEPKVVDSSDLLTSLDEGYPQELQPRDRSRAASKAQISDIANKLNPEFLGDSPKASDGRPLVVPVTLEGKTKYAVISGNGRSEGIRSAYELGKAESYTKFAKEKDSESSHAQPVYVGVLDVNEIKNLPEFAKEANESATAQMSATEQAKSDAERLDADVLNLFVPSDDGTIHGAANRDFTRAFLQKAVPTSEQGRLIDADGKLNQDGTIRVRNAIFAKAFGESEKGLGAIQRMSESTDNNVKNITNALLAKAGALAALKQAANNGTRYKDFDIASDFGAAMEKYADLKESGTSVDEYIQQGNLFGAETTPLQTRVIQVFDKNNRSSKAIRSIINNYLSAVEAIGNPNQQNLFGDNNKPSVETVFEGAVRAYEKSITAEPAEQFGLFNQNQGRENQSKSGFQSNEDAQKNPAPAEQDDRVGKNRIDDKPVYSKEEIEKGEILTGDLITALENDFTVETFARTNITPDGAMNEEAFVLMAHATQKAFNEPNVDFWHGLFLNPEHTAMVRAALVEMFGNPSSAQSKIYAARFLKQFDAAKRPNGGTILIATSRNVPEGTKAAWQEETAHEVDFFSGDEHRISVGIFPADTAAQKAMSHLYANAYRGGSESLLAKEVGAKIWRDDAETELNLSADEVEHLQNLQRRAFSDFGITEEQLEGNYKKIKNAGANSDYDQTRTSIERNRRDSENSEPGGEGTFLRETERRNQRTGSGGDSAADRRPTTTNSSATIAQETNQIGQVRDLDSYQKPENTVIALKSADDVIKAATFDDRELNALYNKAAPKEKSVVQKIISKALWNGKESSAFDIITSVRRAGLLTGVKTHLRNILSNAAFQVSEEAHRPISALADIAISVKTGTRTVQGLSPIAAGKSFAALAHQDKTLKKLDVESGIKTAWQILRDGDSKENLEKQQLSEMKSGLPILDGYVKSVFRALSAEDAIFKIYSVRRALEEQASTIAQTEARNGKLSGWRKRRKELLENPTAQMQAEAVLYADFMTFQNDNKISSAVSSGKQWLKENGGTAGGAAVFAAETVVPFDKTPTNIVLRVLDYTPLGLVRAGASLGRLRKGTSEDFEKLVSGIDKKNLKIDVRREEIRKRFDERFQQRINEKGIELNRISSEIKSLEKQSELSGSLQKRLDALKYESEKLKIKIQDLETARRVRKAKNHLKDAQLIDAEEAVEEMMKTVFSRREQRAFANSIGRASLGSAALGLGILLASKGLLSGVWDAGDKDQMNEFFKRKNNDVENGSLEIPNVGRFVILDSPMGKIMATGATIYERSVMKRKGKQTETGKNLDAAKDIANSLVKDQPLLNAVDDYFGKNKTIEERAGGLLSSFVPSILNSFAEAADPQARDTKGSILAPSIKKIPILRENLPVAKHPRSPFLRDTTNRAINQIDPTNYRPTKKTR